MDYLDEWWHKSNGDDDKELNLKIFELKSAYISDSLDEMLFEEIFGLTFVALANKLINTTNKKENQILLKIFKKNMDKLYEQDNFHNFIIQPTPKCLDLIVPSEIILKVNETIQLDGD